MADIGEFLKGLPCPFEVQVKRPCAKVEPAPPGFQWHNCDGEIGKLLHWLVNPPAEYGGKATWAVRMIIDHGATFVPIEYCPICGEKLEPMDA